MSLAQLNFSTGRALLTCILLLGYPQIQTGWAATIDFEGLLDSTILTSQYPGLTFTNGTILTAGISLNELEFPPHSGSNVTSDNGGPLTIRFATPISSFAGYFTYAEPVAVEAFDSAMTQIASRTSAFSNNEALSGDPGSSPNEFIQLSSALGISTVLITADPSGQSFTLDDAAYKRRTAAVPEPATYLQFLMAAGAIMSCCRRRQS